MSLISQNAIPYKKREKLEADERNDFDEKPEQFVPKKKKRSSDDDVRLRNEQEKEMKRLESALFGTLYAPPEFGREEEAESIREVPFFFTDKSTGDEPIVYEEDLNARAEEVNDEEIKEEKKPAWIDEEEQKVGIDILKVHRLRKLRKEPRQSLISGEDYVSRLRAQHSKLNPGTEWAKIGRKPGADFDSSDDESDLDSGLTVARGYTDIEGDDVFRSNRELVVKSRVKLLPGLLEHSRLIDANREEPSNGPINSVEFHRNGQLLLTAGLDKKLRFFQVDGKRNTKVQSMFIEDCPIHKASFLPDGSQVIISGRRKFFYSFDL